MSFMQGVFVKDVCKMTYFWPLPTCLHGMILCIENFLPKNNWKKLFVYVMYKDLNWCRVECIILLLKCVDGCIGWLVEWKLDMCVKWSNYAILETIFWWGSSLLRKDLGMVAVNWCNRCSTWYTCSWKRILIMVQFNSCMNNQMGWTVK